MEDQPDCCPLRSYFLLQIVGARPDMPEPVEVADFVVQWEPFIIVATKFCPFCGTEIPRDRPRNVVMGAPK